MLTFENPLLLVLSLLGFAAALWVARRRRGRNAISVPLGPPGGVAFESPVRTDLLVRLLSWAEFLGILALIVALSGPVRVSSERVFLERGADILFVIDASPSMSARDMGSENRFEAACRLIRGFADARPADAIGLVALGDSAALLVPPTVDRSVLLSRLAALKIGELGDGTALGLGLSIASLHLSSSRAPRRAAILITDGENNAGEIHPATAAQSIHSIGASLWILGVGSSGETMLDYVDPVTKKHRSGLFTSRFDPEALRSIALAGGGNYLSAPSIEAFSGAFSRMNREEATVTLARERLHRESLQNPFIVLALLLLGVARLIRRFILGAIA